MQKKLGDFKQFREIAEFFERIAQKYREYRKSLKR